MLPDGERKKQGKEKVGRLAEKQRGWLRDMALSAWGDLAAFPWMWLLLSASAVPMVFLFHFLIIMAATTLSLFLLLVGYAVCFCLHFIFWCTAVSLYAGRSPGEKKASFGRAYRKMLEGAGTVFLTGLTWGVIAVMANMAAQMAVGILLSFLLAGGAAEGSLVVVSVLQYFYLGYLVADLALVLVVMAPQVITLGGTRKVEETLRAGYQLVRQRYGDGLKLLIFPEFVIRTLMLGLHFLLPLLKLPGLIFAVYLLFMALLEGGKTAFVASAFNRFFFQIMEEEKKRKTTGKKGKK